MGSSANAVKEDLRDRQWRKLAELSEYGGAQPIGASASRTSQYAKWLAETAESQKSREFNGLSVSAGSVGK
jgi:hypothetical protein